MHWPKRLLRCQNGALDRSSSILALMLLLLSFSCACLAQSSFSSPSSLQYRASLSLMHPLVADVYAMRVATSAPLRAAHMYYAVLARGASINQTALEAKHAHAVMQPDARNTTHSLFYVSSHGAQRLLVSRVLVGLSLTHFFALLSSSLIRFRWFLRWESRSLRASPSSRHLAPCHRSQRSGINTAATFWTRRPCRTRTLLCRASAIRRHRSRLLPPLPARPLCHRPSRPV